MSFLISDGNLINPLSMVFYIYFSFLGFAEILAERGLLFTWEGLLSRLFAEDYCISGGGDSSF
jgi:hypothetical protein